MMGEKGSTFPRTTTQESYIFHALVSPDAKLINYDVQKVPQILETFELFYLLKLAIALLLVTHTPPPPPILN